MGEARRLRDNGIQMKQVRPGEQFAVDLKNAIQKECECGCKHFIPAFNVYTVSALVSPTGQELTAQQQILICMDCKKTL
jgi:hypothetical protein